MGVFGRGAGGWLRAAGLAGVLCLAVGVVAGACGGGSGGEVERPAEEIQEALPSDETGGEGSPAAPLAEPPPPAPEPPPPPRSEPPPAPEPEPPVEVEASLTVVPAVIEPGDSARVEVRGVEAAAAVVAASGRAASLVQVGVAVGVGGEEEVWLGYVSVTPLAEEGVHAVAVDLFDAEGTLVGSLEGEFEVRLPEPPAPVPGAEGEAADEGPVEAIALPPEVAALLTVENVRFDDRVRFEVHAQVSGPPRWSGPWMRPVDGIDDSPFGQLRSFNGGPATDWHHGHDFVVDQGMPIRAAAAGTVAFAGALPLHGQGVIVDHGAGVFSGYWHMSEVSVVAGVEVLAGTEIGLVGSTGLSTGPHLHWEVVVNGQDVDPVQWLGPELHP